MWTFQRWISKALKKNREVTWFGKLNFVLFFNKQVICPSLCMLDLHIPPGTIDDSPATPT